VYKSPTIVYTLYVFIELEIIELIVLLFNYIGGSKGFVGQLLLSFFVTIPTILPPIYKFKYLFSCMNLIVDAPLVILACDITLSYHGPIPSLFPLFFFIVALILQKYK
jgi:hypothetical protein